MILGLGLDICNVARMRKAIISERLVRRIFRPEEIAYADGKGSEYGRAASYASAFAAREAFCKASGISMYKVALASQICLSRSEGGAPRLIVPPELPGFEGSAKRVWVSLSHDGDYAAAVVVIEGVES